MDGVQLESESAAGGLHMRDLDLCILGPAEECSTRRTKANHSTNVLQLWGKGFLQGSGKLSSRMGKSFLHFKCYSSALMEGCVSIVLHLWRERHPGSPEPREPQSHTAQHISHERFIGRKNPGEWLPLLKWESGGKEAEERGLTLYEGWASQAADWWDFKSRAGALYYAGQGLELGLACTLTCYEGHTEFAGFQDAHKIYSRSTRLWWWGLMSYRLTKRCQVAPFCENPILF